jgi:hypothetical protein
VPSPPAHTHLVNPLSRPSHSAGALAKFKLGLPIIRICVPWSARPSRSGLRNQAGVRAVI